MSEKTNGVRNRRRIILGGLSALAFVGLWITVSPFLWWRSFRAQGVEVGGYRHRCPVYRRGDDLMIGTVPDSSVEQMHMFVCYLVHPATMDVGEDCGSSKIDANRDSDVEFWVTPFVAVSWYRNPPDNWDVHPKLTKTDQTLAFHVYEQYQVIITHWR